ncbi:hypothetical protein LZC95_25520 [Pendulispora brunnea]|uniref:Uncharacterized protein n=1 Tax=Pendulispora brunnea TaxID=2905690 RepID=A0ABZ2KV22_9BACT
MALSIGIIVMAACDDDAPDGPTHEDAGDAGNAADAPSFDASDADAADATPDGGGGCTIVENEVRHLERTLGQAVELHRHPARSRLGAISSYLPEMSYGVFGSYVELDNLPVWCSFTSPAWTTDESGAYPVLSCHQVAGASVGRHERTDRVAIAGPMEFSHNDHGRWAQNTWESNASGSLTISDAEIHGSWQANADTDSYYDGSIVNEKTNVSVQIDVTYDTVAPPYDADAGIGPVDDAGAFQPVPPLCITSGKLSLQSSFIGCERVEFVWSGCGQFTRR